MSKSLVVILLANHKYGFRQSRLVVEIGD